MAKRKVKSQTANLTPDHLKSKIALISLCAGAVSHTVEKISTRSTTFRKTSLQLKVCTQNYGPPKLWESQFQKIWESRDKMTFGCWPYG